MTFDDILMLARAGFSAQQISMMYSAQTVQTPPTVQNPPTQPTQPTVQNPPTQPTQPTVQNPPTQPTQPQENETQTMLREMLGLIRGSNINGMSQPNAEPDDPAKIMAAILAPTPSTK